MRNKFHSYNFSSLSVHIFDFFFSSVSSSFFFSCINCMCEREIETKRPFLNGSNCSNQTKLIINFCELFTTSFVVKMERHNTKAKSNKMKSIAVNIKYMTLRMIKTNYAMCERASVANEYKYIYWRMDHAYAIPLPFIHNYVFNSFESNWMQQKRQKKRWLNQYISFVFNAIGHLSLPRLVGFFPPRHIFMFRIKQ